jgi:hypothetical protein
MNQEDEREMQAIVDRLIAEGRMPSLEKLAEAMSQAAEQLRSELRAVGKGRRSLEKRDAEILRRYEAGESCAQLAPLFGLTPRGLENVVYRTRKRALRVDLN